MSLAKFISSIRPLREDLIKKGASILYVVGNESCDLDSCTSSILTAFICSNLMSTGKSPLNIGAQAAFPLLNINKDDLRLRKDILYLFSNLGIKSEGLLFLEDIKTHRPEDHIFLVDHNKITPTLSKVFTPNQVVGVIDHHDNEDLYKESITKANGPLMIKRSGSCSSSVVNYWSQLAPELFDDDDAQLAELALAPLLIDTSNMKAKVEEPDTAAFEWLKSKIKDPSFNRKAYYSALKSNKQDLEGFIGTDLIRKDYKMWEQPDGSLPIGISSIGRSLTWIYQNDPNFDEAVEKFATDQGLSVYACLTSFVDESGKHRREIGIWTKDQDTKTLAVDKFSDISRQGLGLEPKSLSLPATTLLATKAQNSNKAVSKLTVFEQGVDRATRKQVAPLLRCAVHGINLEQIK